MCGCWSRGQNTTNPVRMYINRLHGAHTNKLVRRSSAKLSAQDQVGLRGQRGESSHTEREVSAFFREGWKLIRQGGSGVRQRRRQPSKTALPSLTNRASALVGGSIFEAATAMEHFQTTASYPRAVFAPTMKSIVDTPRSKRRTVNAAGLFRETVAAVSCFFLFRRHAVKTRC